MKMVLSFYRKMIIYQVDRAKVLDASAFADETTIQLKRLGAKTTSNSKIITDNNVTVFDKHNAVR
jgi:hypothetical protein